MTDRGNLLVDGLPSPELLVQRPGAALRRLAFGDTADVAARWLGVTALAGFALRQRGWFGLGAAVTGVWLARSALRRMARPARDRPVSFAAAITIGLDPERVFEVWQDPDALGRLLTHLRIGRPEAATPDVFRISAPAADGRVSSWLARRTVTPPDTIVWRSIDDSVPWHCELTVRPASRHRGSEVRLSMTYGPGVGDIGRIGAGAADDLDRSWSITTDLRRLKQQLETGEIATTDGQPRGPSRPATLPERVLAEDHTPVLALDSATTAGGFR